MDIVEGAQPGKSGTAMSRIKCKPDLYNYFIFYKMRNFYNDYNEEIIIYKKDQWDKTYGGIYTQMDRW